MTENVLSMVHFVYGDTHVPAIVIASGFVVHNAAPGTLENARALTVFVPNEPPFTTVAEYDAAGATGTWHWPERE